MMIDPPAVLPIVEAQTAEMFYYPAHQVIFELLLAMWKAKRPADFITLTVRLREAGRLDEVGGPAFITHLFTFTPTSANAEYYLDTVRDRHAQRRIISTCTQYASWAYEPQPEVDLLQDALEAEVLHLPGSRAATAMAYPAPDGWKCAETIRAPGRSRLSMIWRRSIRGGRKSSASSLASRHSTRWLAELRPAR